jgi:hypothetical protein
LSIGYWKLKRLIPVAPIATVAAAASAVTTTVATATTTISAAVATTITTTASEVASFAATVVAATIVFHSWRSRQQRLARQAHFAGLFVYFNELDFDLVAFFQYIFHIVDAGVTDFRNVQQATLAIEVNKYAIRHH